jgi:MFS transporter, ACS family, tartrate transporter
MNEAVNTAGAVGAATATAADPAGDAILARVRMRLLPLLVLLFVVSYLDRVNVSFAKLTMNAALGIDDTVYALAAGIFFIGYFIFEVPSNLILQRVGARRWIARIMLTWGLVSGATAFVTGANSFIAMRFLLGIAEAGFFPGVLLYLTYWFPDRERARVIGLFMVAVPLTGVVGSPLSGYLLKLDGVLGLQGWQWLLLLEAAPAILLGAVCLKFLPNGPADAAWLEPHERAWLTATLAAESESVKRTGHASLRAALAHPRVWALAIAYLGIVIAVYGLNFWLPTLVNNYGIAITWVGWITMLPFACGAAFMVWWGRRSDRKAERVRHLAVTSLLGLVGFAGASVAGSLSVQIGFLCIAALGIYGSLPVYWTFPSAILTSTAAAAGLALINSVGNLGGYFGPQIVAAIRRVAGGFGPSLFVLGLFMLVPTIIVLIMARGGRK